MSALISRQHLGMSNSRQAAWLPSSQIQQTRQHHNPAGTSKSKGRTDSAHSGHLSILTGRIISTETPTKPRPFPACPDVLEHTRQNRKRLAQSAGPLRPSMAVSPKKKKVFFNNVLMVTSSPSPHIPPCCLHTRVASPKGREIGVGMARETGVMCCVLMS